MTYRDSNGGYHSTKESWLRAEALIHPEYAEEAGRLIKKHRRNEEIVETIFTIIGSIAGVLGFLALVGLI